MYEYKKYGYDDPYTDVWELDCLIEKYMSMVKSSFVSDREKEIVKDVVSKEKTKPVKTETKIKNELLLLLA
jgi:hypothetical protein